MKISITFSSSICPMLMILSKSRNYLRNYGIFFKPELKKLLTNYHNEVTRTIIPFFPSHRRSARLKINNIQFIIPRKFPITHNNCPIPSLNKFRSGCRSLQNSSNDRLSYSKQTNMKVQMLEISFIRSYMKNTLFKMSKNDFFVCYLNVKRTPFTMHPILLIFQSFHPHFQL